VDTSFGEGHVAGLTAIGAVIEAVHTEMHAFLAFADAAIFLAGAKRFRLFALHADNRRTRHERLHENCT
jgi:hypothetical protein